MKYLPSAASLLPKSFLGDCARVKASLRIIENTELGSTRVASIAASLQLATEDLKEEMDES
jgi:hypothetical protein